MNSEQRAEITEVLLASGRYLDEGDFASYLSLYSDQAEYQIVAQVPEIAGTATWVDLTKAELQNLLDSADRHMWNTGQRTHHIAAPSFTQADTQISTLSAVAVFRTCSGGSTTLYAVGKYHDHWVSTAAGWRLQKRVLQLDTRNLTPPSSLPM